MTVAKKKMSKISKKEKLISNWAFAILFALCIQILVYLVILNFCPTLINDSNGNVFINPLYFVEKDYYGSSQYDNGTRIIYYYNMCLLIASITLILYYMIDYMEVNEGKVISKVKSFFKEQWPFAILLAFMLWVFISSLLAEDYYRSFVGCFNLKDGYFSFMMYGSMLVCSMLLMKEDSEKYRNVIVNTFLITATILAVLSLWNYFYFYSDMHDGSSLITSTAYTIGEVLFGNGGVRLGNNFLIVTKRIVGEANTGIFHNSNHYGYYLSISVIVAATMAIKENKKYLLKILYFISYIIMLVMAILNNTLGAYLGIGASILFMIVYSLMRKENNWLKELISTALVVAIFVLISCSTVNVKGDNIVYNNFAGLAKDFNILVSNKNNLDNDNETLNDKEENIESTIEEKEEDKNAVSDIGSGRGILWAKAAIMALQRPLFGYGLENIKYQYDRQFDINEGRSHNLILQLAATTGIVGMLLYVIGIASIWIKKLRYIREWNVYDCLGMFVIVSYIVSSLVGNSAFYTSGYFYIFVGFVVLSPLKNVLNEKKETKKVKNK